ncbi:unnamed protein product [Symbiodinium pilosum]|uniref:Uncharacterized protein n=1 Tax=Symbiodinium pilosum TaxID=2952 RepID=A0A812XE09_SYMPI|nr:unnamed protein product [Symbiodinium pilosum]
MCFGQAFDKRLCPLYHGVFEMAKHDRPLVTQMGDEAQEIWEAEMPRLGEGRSPYPGPKFHDDRCKDLAGDLQPLDIDAEGDARLPQHDGFQGLDLNAGITRYLESHEASDLSGKAQASCLPAAAG